MDKLTGTQIALAFGTVCVATAAAVGLGFRALQKRYSDAPVFISESNENPIIAMIQSQE